VASAISEPPSHKSPKQPLPHLHAEIIYSSANIDSLILDNFLMEKFPTPLR
jgi:hypothetical protein